MLIPTYPACLQMCHQALHATFFTIPWKNWFDVIVRIPSSILWSLCLAENRITSLKWFELNCSSLSWVVLCVLLDVLYVKGEVWFGEVSRRADSRLPAVARGNVGKRMGAILLVSKMIWERELPGQEYWKAVEMGNLKLVEWASGYSGNRKETWQEDLWCLQKWEIKRSGSEAKWSGMV